MTQFSFPWSAVAAGDGGPTAYDLAVVEGTNKFLHNLSLTDSGVSWWQQSPNAGLLEPTNPAGATVRIASGVGVVEGWLYTNDANVDFDIDAAPGNASATDIIVLQRVAASQTVRLARIGGAAASKAVLTPDSSDVAIPIVDVLLDGAGLFASITDARKLALPPGTVVKLAEILSPGGAAISFSSIPPLFSNLRVVARARSTNAGLLAEIAITFNGVTNPLDYAYIFDSQFATPSSQVVGDTFHSSMDCVRVTAAGGTANYFDGFEIVIPAYATTGYKSILTKYSHFSVAATLATGQGAGWLRTLLPITQIDITDVTGWATGTKVVLYGEA